MFTMQKQSGYSTGEASDKIKAKFAELEETKENAKMWRKDLADTINATNERLGIAVSWEHRSFKEQAKAMLEIAKQEVRSIQYSKIKNAAVSVKNEVLEMIGRVQEKMGRLTLPIVSAKYLAKIPNRDKVQDIENAKNFLERNRINTFAQLEKFKTDKGKEFDRREQILFPSGRDWNS